MKNDFGIKNKNLRLTTMNLRFRTKYNSTKNQIFSKKTEQSV